MTRRQMFVTSLLGLVGIRLEAQSGFVLRAPINFAGFNAGMMVWSAGNQMFLTAMDPSLTTRLRELEGKKVVITITAE